MRQMTIRFLKDDSGAVSADWVAITAAVVLFAVAISASVKTSTVNAGNTLGNNITAMATP